MNTHFKMEGIVMSKVIFITGAANGIGLAATQHLLDQGHNIFGADIDEAGLATITSDNFHPMIVDVSKDEQIENAVSEIIETSGTIDAVIANAGYTLMGAIEMTEMSQVRKQFDVNFFGVVKTIQCALSHMRKAKKGKIIITSSVVSNIPCPSMAFYPATKHALEAYGNALRMEVQEFGIDVILVHPGFQNTSLMGASFLTLDQAETKDHENVYKQMHEDFRAAFSRNFTGGGSPDSIGKLMAKIIGNSKPKYHYRPGFDSISGYYLTKFAPWKLFDKIAKKKVLGR